MARACTRVRMCVRECVHSLERVLVRELSIGQRAHAPLPSLPLSSPRRGNGDKQGYKMVSRNNGFSGRTAGACVRLPMPRQLSPSFSCILHPACRLYSSPTHTHTRTVYLCCWPCHNHNLYAVAYRVAAARRGAQWDIILLARSSMVTTTTIPISVAAACLS